MSFSVLMSVYAKEKPEYLEEALKSVINQTLQSNEIYIIKDGPLTNELDSVIDRYCKKYDIIKTYQFSQNVKLGRALAKGVELCTNDIIARMDTDDIALPNRFEVQYQYMQAHPDISVVGGQIEEFNENNETRTKIMPVTQNEIYRYSKMRNPLNHMTVMFRKKDILAVGNYQHFPLLEDYFLWSRLLSEHYKITNIQQVLVKARTEQDIYKRRGGFAYFKSHKALRKKQYELGLLNCYEYSKAVAGSFIFAMQPNWARKIVYRKVLRK